MNVISFEVTHEVYNEVYVTSTVERVFHNIMAATSYIRRHRDELCKHERFGLLAVTESGERIALH